MISCIPALIKSSPISNVDFAKCFSAQYQRLKNEKNPQIIQVPYLLVFLSHLTVLIVNLLLAKHYA